MTDYLRQNVSICKFFYACLDQNHLK